MCVCLIVIPIANSYCPKCFSCPNNLDPIFHRSLCFTFPKHTGSLVSSFHSWLLWRIMLGSNPFISGGQRKAKAPEKSNFVQTCNLLSQYIKEKGSLRDLNLEIGGKVENLEHLVKSGFRHHSESSAPATNEVSKDQGKGRSSPPSKAPDSSINAPQDSSHHKSTSKDSDSKAAQLTIFYSGKLLVFDDYPADKAKELVAFAKRGSTQLSYGNLSNNLQEKTSPCEGLPPRPHAAAAAAMPSGVSSGTHKEKTDGASCGAVATGSDLPIARRSSIHRFLEKRKDRAAVRGPYHNQVDQEQAASSSKGDEHLQLKL